MWDFYTALNLTMRKNRKIQNLLNFVSMYAYNVQYKAYIIMLNFSCDFKLYG